MTVRTPAFCLHLFEKQQLIGIVDVAETKLTNIAVTDSGIQRKNEGAADFSIQIRIIRRQQLQDLLLAQDLFTKCMGINLTDNIQTGILGQNILINGRLNGLFKTLENRMWSFALKFTLKIGYKLADHILSDLLRLDRIPKKRIFFTKELLKLDFRASNMNNIGFLVSLDINIEPIEKVFITAGFQLIAHAS